MKPEARQVNQFRIHVKQVLALLLTFFTYGCGAESTPRTPIYIAPVWYDSAAHRAVTTRCVWVGDGDTLKTSDEETVRLLGINAPEVAHPARGKPVGEPFGEAARDRLADLVKGETIVLVIPAGRERDAYGRILALVFSGDSPVRGRPSVNEALVREGMAHVFIMENSGFLNTAAWVAVQRKSQHNRLGIWSRAPAELPELATDTRNEAIASIQEWAQAH